LRGPHIRVELDGQEIFNATNDHCQKGSVTLHCRGSSGRFRNIKVTAPDGTILWEGLPDLSKE
jgi:eukaryotic-like serine/threonine-protein kinase